MSETGGHRCDQEATSENIMMSLEANRHDEVKHLIHRP